MCPRFTRHISKLERAGCLNGGQWLQLTTTEKSKDKALCAFLVLDVNKGPGLDGISFLKKTQNIHKLEELPKFIFFLFEIPIKFLI
jgi:hypothetical protein